MPDPSVTRITGKFILSDGSETEFAIYGADRSWMQWGNSNERMGASVDLIDALDVAAREHLVDEDEAEEANEREQLIESLLDEFGIDGSYADVSEDDRYFGVKQAEIDGESNVASTFETLDDAREWFGEFDLDHPRSPLMLIDLATGERTGVSMTLTATITFDNESETP